MKEIKLKDNLVQSNAKIGSWLKSLESELGTNLANLANKGTAILVIDSSASMNESGKISQAKDGAKRFYSDAITKGYSVGMVSFSSEAQLIAEPCRSPSIDQHLNSITFAGSTNMADGIKVAANKMQNMAGRKVLVIITDGYPDSAEAAIAEANRAKQSGYDIITIGTQDADKKFLSNIATAQELSLIGGNNELGELISSSVKLLPEIR